MRCFQSNLPGPGHHPFDVSILGVVVSIQPPKKLDVYGRRSMLFRYREAIGAGDLVGEIWG